MKLVSRADFARLRGVSRAAVTKACQGHLAAACRGDRVDLEHEAAVAYLSAGGKVAPAKTIAPKPSKAQPKKEGQKAAAKPKAPSRKPDAGKRPAARATDEGPDDSAPALDPAGFAPEIADMLVREVAERHGTNRAYKDWLEAYQKQQRAIEIWLKNQQTKGLLIERALVEHNVFGFIDAVFKRLLTDSPKTIAARIQNLTRTGATIEELEREVRSLISTQLQPMKATAARALRNA